MTYVVGICLMAVVAACLVLLALVLRRRYRQRAAMLAAQQQERLAALAARDAAAMQAAARVAQRSGILPVIIMQPDGDISLAETQRGGEDASSPKPDAEAPQPAALLDGTLQASNPLVPFFVPAAAQGGPDLEAGRAAPAV